MCLRGQLHKFYVDMVLYNDLVITQRKLGVINYMLVNCRVYTTQQQGRD